MQESSWNNLIAIPLVIFNGFQDELVAMCSFFTYKFGFEPSWIFSPIKSKVFAKTETRGTVGKSFMQMNETMKTGGLNVYYSYIFLQVIIVISFLKTACFKKKWLYSNKYLFIKLPVTEVEYELLKCLWGAELFFFCQVCGKNKSNRKTCSRRGKMRGKNWPCWTQDTRHKTGSPKARALSQQDRVGKGLHCPRKPAQSFLLG